MVLNSLLNNLDAILGRITASHLRRYQSLQADLRTKDVASDEAYQRTFNGFYKMQRRTREWYAYYFALLQREKNNKSITFAHVLEKIHAEQKRVEPSFTSKLVATIRPEMPVYDRLVRDNLSLEVPAQYRPAHQRVRELGRMYAILEGKINALIADPIFTTVLRPAFDKKWPACAHFSDAKKLDFLLWQFRPQNAQLGPEAITAHVSRS